MNADISVIISKDDSFYVIISKLISNGFEIRNAVYSAPDKKIRIKLIHGVTTLRLVILRESFDIFSDSQFSEFGIDSVKINSDLSFEVIE